MKKIIQFYPYPDAPLRTFANQNPHADQLSYQQQIDMIAEDGVTSAHLWKGYLPVQEWDYHLIIPNFTSAQTKWWQEYGSGSMPRDQVTLALRQIEIINPDILYIMVPTIPYDSNFVRQLARRPRMVVVWRAAIWYGADVREFDLVLGNSTLILDEALSMGARRARVMHPFASPSIAECVKGVKTEFDLVFAGSCEWVHQQRIEVLERLAHRAEAKEFTIGFYITSAQREKLPQVLLRNNREPVWGNELYKVLRKGAICMNVYGHPPAVDGFNMRLLEGLSAGTFMLNQRIAGIEKYFEPGRELDLFDNEEELLRKIHYYLQHAQEREEIALRGQQRCQKEHSPQARAIEFAAVVNEVYDEITQAKSSVVPVAKPNAGKKVVIFSAKDSGGAGIAAYRLHCGLLAAGVDSKMIVLNKVHENDHTVGLLQLRHNNQMLDPWKSFCLAMQTAQQELRDFPNRPAGGEFFSTISSQVSFLELAEIIREADIVNMHWSAGLFDYANAPQVLRDKKVVWTLHDMNPFTGGCHYASDCTRYQEENGCHDCPQLGAGPYDLAQKIWQAKRVACRDLEITTVSPSKWLASCATGSRIFRESRNEMIANSLPLDEFQPVARAQARGRFKLPLDKQVILFGCESVNSHRKGFDLLLEVMQKLPEYVAQPESVLLAVFGKVETQIKIPFPIAQLGVLSSAGDLAAAYSAADVFVITSREDNLPNTVLESLACGTPVVGFRIGGIPDMVCDETVGALAEPFDCNELAIRIAGILAKPAQDYVRDCRDHAQTFYASAKQAEAYSCLFDELLCEGAASPSASMPTCAAPLEEPRKHPEAAGTCPLCGGRSLSQISVIRASALIDTYQRKHNIDVSGYFTQPQVRLLQCPDCDLRHFDPPCSGDGKFYSALESFDWYYVREKNEYRYVRMLLRPDTDRVLEIGCGEAFFQEFCSIRHYTGLELNDHAVGKAREKGLNVVNQPLADHVRQCPQSYDVVCCFQVLEHVADPQEFIACAIRGLKENGLFIVSVPSESTFLGSITANELNSPPHHCLLWTQKALRHIAGQFGLQLLDLHQEPLQPEHFDWYILEMRLAWLRERLELGHEKFADVFAGKNILGELAAKCPDLNPQIARFILGNDFLPVMKEFFAGMPASARPAGHTITAVFRKGGSTPPRPERQEARQIARNTAIRQKYTSLGLPEKDIAELDRVIGCFANEVSVNNLWKLLDGVWDEIGCDADNPTPEQLSAFYAHPLWVINGLITESDPEACGYREKLCQWIAENAAAAGIGRLLDYGGGWGTVDRILAGKAPQLQVEVYEPYPNPAALKQSARYQNLRFVSTFNSPYDCILAIDVLEHSCDMLKSLEEIVRLTRLNGLVILGNCFEPVVKCHLPRNMHFKKTFVGFAEKMGLKKLGFVLYFEIFRKVSDRELSDSDWRELRDMEEQSNREHGGKPYRALLEHADAAASPASTLSSGTQNKILVSAIVSTYKSARYIRAAIEDLFAQTLYRQGRLEIVIINSNSPENEDEIIRETIKGHQNVVYQRTEERETLYKAWNRGVAVASGKYLTNANTDDRHIPQCLEIMAQALEESGAALAYADIAVTEDERVEIGSSPVNCLYCWPEYERNLFFANCFFGPQPMWRASMHQKYGLFDPEMKCAGDFDMWLRMAAGGETFVHIPRVFGLMLKSNQSLGLHNGQLTFNEAETGRRRSWKPEWGAMPAQRGIPVVKRIEPGVNPYGAYTQGSQTAAPAAHELSRPAQMDSVQALVQLLADAPDNQQALNQLRSVRTDFAQSILNLPDGDFAASYALKLAPVLELLLNSPLRYFPLLAEEQNNLQAIRQKLTDNTPEPMKLKFFCLLTLYVCAYEAEVDLRLFPYNSFLQKLALNYVFVPPAVFIAPGAADRYARHMQSATAMIHAMIASEPQSPVTIACAMHFLQYENFISVYFNSLNLCEIYRQRAEIMSFGLRQNGFILDWTPPKRPKNRKKIHLGFLKVHYGPHTETYTSLPFFEHLDREKFDITLFSMTELNTDLAKYCANRADRAIIILPSDLRTAVQTVRAADIDVLVFCTNLTAVTNHATILACHKMARVQLVNHSSPTTSGMPFSDGFLSGTAVCDTQDHYTEKLYLLEGGTHCFAYSADNIAQHPDFTRERLGLTPQDTLFMSGANFYKIIPELMEVWAEILSKLPAAKLFLVPFSKAWSNSYPEKLFIHTFENILQRHGANAKQLVISENLPDRNAVNKLLKVCDVCLDAIPYSGANSVFDPLEAGKPMICVAGKTFRNDQGPAILRSVGLQELIAADVRGYIDLAVKLVTNQDYYADLCARISAIMQNTPPFLDRVEYGKEAGRVYQQAWSDYQRR